MTALDTTQANPTEAFFRDLEEKVKGPAGALEGKKALIIGIANNQSIAYGCALAFRAMGASIAMTYRPAFAAGRWARTCRARPGSACTR